MPAIKFSIPHQLSQQEAQRRLQSLFPQLEHKYSAFITQANYQWQDNVCDFQLFIRALAITGKLVVRAAVIDLELDLPLAGMFFKDKIQQTIQTQADRLLGSGKK